ncbi:MAG: 50S ribosomal protein L25 [Parcubacteria group bacterium]|nr:50S ribosomal protein L25 [Parcubacteria group bacterium]
MVTLNIETRTIPSNLEAIRSKGLLPAVFYGKKEKSTPITLAYKDFMKAWKEAGESSVITLKTKEGDLEALIHAVDLDPVTDAPRHADFYVFEKGQKIEVSVPIEFFGVSPAVKEMGAILIKALHEINIEAMPKDLPHEIKVDISSLVDLDSQILAKDVVLPSGVTLIEKPEEVVASVDEAREEVEEVVEAPDLSQIEVEKKGKKEEEGGEEASAGAPDAKKEEKNEEKGGKK